MARYEEEETPWTRQLLVGIGVLVAVSLVIGGVVSVVALGAAKVTGINGPQSGATQKPSLFIPSGSPTTRAGGVPDPSGAAGSSSSASSSPSPSPTRTKKPVDKGLTLRAFPVKVAAGQRIYLTGTYTGGAGARLQVQRFEGGWADFPVTAGVAGEQFSTYVSTDRTGLNRFRVLDPANNRSSNVVRVTVG
jgi:hypothetical protein